MTILTIESDESEVSDDNKHTMTLDSMVAPASQFFEQRKLTIALHSTIQGWEELQSRALPPG